MKPKYSQKQLAFYQLLHTEDWQAPHDFMGEKMIDGEWYFGGYKITARLSNLFLENPKLLVREYYTGRSGAEYYRYRIAPQQDLFDSLESRIKDKSLLEMLKI